MYRSNSTRIFPIIIIIVVVVALIFGLVTVGRQLFSKGNKSDTESAQAKASEQLRTVDAGRSVRMTIRGPIVANEDFRSYQVTVSPSTRTYTVYKGYLDSVDSTKSYDNNTAAYTQFVYALDKAAMTKEGKYAEKEAGDLRGICATGKVYQYEILNADTAINTFWTSTCKGSPGTFGASVDQVTNLFVTQIPGLKNNFTTTTLAF